MRTSIVISVLLGAGALGHPSFRLNDPLSHLHHHKRQGAPAEVKTWEENGRVIVDDIFIKTVYGNSVPAPSPAAVAAPVAEKVAVAPVHIVTAAAAAAAPVQVHEEYAQSHHEEAPPQQQEQQQKAPVVETTPVAAPAATVQTQAASSAPSSSDGSGDGSPTYGGKSILATANHYRKLQGFNDFTYDGTLQSNSAKTLYDNGANHMTHELNSGSFAQCLAEGSTTASAGDLKPFDMVYLGWLCEIDSSDIMEDCQTMNSTIHMGVDFADPEGHANILRTAAYTKIGCAFQTATETQTYSGLWSCDFAY